MSQQDIEGKESVLSSEPSDEKDKEPHENYMGVGIALGVGIGLAVGSAMGNVAVGLAVGIALGIALGIGLTRRSPA